MGEDLASSTEHSLCSGLCDLGFEVTLVSPGRVEDSNYSHYQINDLRFPGLSSISGSVKANRIVKKLGIEKFDFLIVDWRYIFSIANFLGDFPIPWMIIDRGPPAKKGPLNRLQKIQWKRAWKMAGRGARGGFVVSEKHRDFVMGLTGVKDGVEIIPAGSSRNRFPLEKGNPEKLLNLCYIGQIDRRRGIGKIIELSHCLRERGVDHIIDICGKGDFEKDLSIKSKEIREIKFHGVKKQNEVFHLLSKSHVGIMPMPDIPVWRVASPLKLANYLASGLAVIGPDHPGNRSSKQGKWNLLKTSDWAGECAESLSVEIQNGWDGIVSSALRESESLSWDSITARMAGVITRELDSTSS